ncbi:hypothetical protein A2229_02980 [Candidatus Peregrinibacteria bacterium RIFOXYA2_FULL_33_7]|nr:MAG: hypothetical protein A2229_02980 [Candidatus Peregrinibacteria bacterium RIFOXYA2_FULL_33_7]
MKKISLFLIFSFVLVSCNENVSEFESEPEVFTMTVAFDESVFPWIIVNVQGTIDQFYVWGEGEYIGGSSQTVGLVLIPETANSWKVIDTQLNYQKKVVFSTRIENSFFFMVSLQDPEGDEVALAFFALSTDCKGKIIGLNLYDAYSEYYDF